ncbi:putative PEP-binding protein [Aeromicrobium sp. Leaf245]|uniref:putative PEP-binding protein n=1 Tax=Aeromicrobium sp. Leaf245 TaxID=1736306 RepID=UPI0006FA56C0|nr:putative PEP-binding protein [Aeromicrobium sp. Leaf245]KQO36143.1 phosphoenolpyruvate-protein phosphotransferase [Aeromicrobium sp. Leaf245]
MTTVTLIGTPVVAGVGHGAVLVPGDRPAVPADEPARDDTPAVFASAAAVVADRLQERAALSTGSASEVLSATAALVQDRGLAALVAKHAGAGNGPATSTSKAVDELVAMFTAAGGVMAERVTDLRDVRDRVVAEILGQPEPGVGVPTQPSVLLADDLAPADTAGLDPTLVVGIAVRLGGPTSHTAIIARQLGIPCVVGIVDLPQELPATALVDGGTGEVVLSPDADAARTRVEADAVRRSADAAWEGPGRTADGHAVQVLANVQDAAGAERAAQEPVEGFGLYRTELSFLDRPSEPSVQEQTSIYAAVMEAAGAGKVVVRTLDAGSDKPLAFADMGSEANPALGVRGLRVARRRPDLLAHQLDAVAAAADATEADVWVMAPMVSVPSEAAAFAAQCRERGLVPGVMVETPSAALLADRVLEHVDFVSIGTNDLSQYTFAADRMSAELGDLTDPWQPGLLVLVEAVARAGERAGKPVGVCGEAAADPALACVLVGLGVTSLSCAAGAVRPVGARLASVTLAQCQEAARAAVAAADPTAARAAVADVLDA